jgi:hypothetical protein
MNESRRRLIQGVVIGSFLGAGSMLIAFWRIITLATNAGAMVEGQFRPYQAMPEWHILLIGGLIIVVVALAFLMVTWRGVRAPSS